MSDELKYTSGPWTVPHFALDGDGHCKCQYVLCEHYMGAIATVHVKDATVPPEEDGDDPVMEEAIGNAHLIAAAPDLLNVVVRGREVLRQITQLANINDGTKELLIALGNEFNAVAKLATTRQQYFKGTINLFEPAPSPVPALDHVQSGSKEQERS